MNECMHGTFSLVAQSMILLERCIACYKSFLYINIKSSYVPVLPFSDSAVCNHSRLLAFSRWPPFSKVKGQTSENMICQQIKLVTSLSCLLPHLFVILTG